MTLQNVERFMCQYHNKLLIIGLSEFNKRFLTHKDFKLSLIDN